MIYHQTCHNTRQTRFLPTTMKPMSAVFNVIHSSAKPTEHLFLSQARIEPGSSVPFFQSADAVQEGRRLNVGGGRERGVGGGKGGV